MTTQNYQIERQAARGRLQARPAQPAQAGTPGLHPLELDAKRDGLLYVPAAYSPANPARLVLMLHGAGGNAEGGLRPFRNLADTSNLILMAVSSRRETWDVLRGAYGPDVAMIDRALAQTFQGYHVDPAHIAVEGFSDGASYALSLGLTNGDLFTHIIAFAPGFMAPASQHGAPDIFISHGTEDGVLPVDRCSRRLVPQLKQAGYRVDYREFSGPHTVPESIAQDALDWFTDTKELT